MLTKLNNLPEYVFGVRPSGEVTKADMENVLLPGLDELAARTGKLNYLLVLETGVQNFSLAAWWDDIKTGLKHYTDWNRIAVVTDQKAVEWFTDIFQFTVPGKSKGFTLAEEQEAINWVSLRD